MNTFKKGKKMERQWAAQLEELSPGKVYCVPKVKFCEEDIFGTFDVLQLTGLKIHLDQVTDKAHKAAKIKQVKEWKAGKVLPPNIVTTVVCYDDKGKWTTERIY